MTYQEIWDKARSVMGPNCRVCPECNGKACKGEIPGVGGIGDGSSFTVCREYLRRVKVLMDLVYEPGEIDTSVELFGRKFGIPFFLAPIGGMNGNYNGYMTDAEFLKMCVDGMAEAGGFSFTPDAPYEELFRDSLPPIKEAGGLGVPTVKPWDTEKLLQRIRDIEAAGALAVACDIDSCGNRMLRMAGKPVLPMSPARMAEVVGSTRLPFIPKGVMTAEAAVKCADAGCYGIIVSSHGGRVLENSPAPCSMLPEIRAAVGDRIKIFVDGGVRSGMDVFRCLPLGADAVLIGRPYVVAAHGAGKDGIVFYTKKILEELRDVMLMTGCKTLADIDMSKIRIE